MSKKRDELKRLLLSELHKRSKTLKDRPPRGFYQEMAAKTSEPIKSIYSAIYEMRRKAKCRPLTDQQPQDEEKGTIYQDIESAGAIRTAAMHNIHVTDDLSDELSMIKTRHPDALSHVQPKDRVVYVTLWLTEEYCQQITKAA